MKNEYTFTATIENARGGGAFVRVPFNVEQVFGKKRVPVRATIDGQPYRGTLVRMGEPCHILGVLKEIRLKIGKDFGDDVDVILEEDDEPRLVSVPPDLEQALRQNPQAEAVFRQLSYTHQKEYVTWIIEAKKDDTRARRVAQTIVMVKKGK